MKLRIAESVAFEVVDDQAVVLDLKQGTYFSLNKTGTAVWRLIQEHGNIDAVVEGMQLLYPVDRPKLEKDVTNLVRSLLDKRLVVQEPAG